MGMGQSPKAGGAYRELPGGCPLQLIHQYGAWIVFALVLLESIGLPLPGEAILVSAAIFAGTTQELGIALILLSAVLGAIFGSIIGFWIGDRTDIHCCFATAPTSD
jgi:membrane protein DedA with SNARE-associated domain